MNVTKYFVSTDNIHGMINKQWDVKMIKDSKKNVNPHSLFCGCHEIGTEWKPVFGNAI